MLPEDTEEDDDEEEAEVKEVAILGEGCLKVDFGADDAIATFATDNDDEEDPTALFLGFSVDDLACVEEVAVMTDESPWAGPVLMTM